MRTNQSNASSRLKSFGLLACAIVAVSALTTQHATAQCRNGLGNPGYGHTSHHNNNFNTGYLATGNSARYGYGTTGNNYNLPGNYNNRQQTSYQGAYGAYSAYPGSTVQRPLLSPGLSYNSGQNSLFNSSYNNYRTNSNLGYDSYGSRVGYNTGNYNSGSYNSGNYGSSQQPVAFRHGDHIDVEVGSNRYHTTGSGY